jgi:hypothetical protein
MYVTAREGYHPFVIERALGHKMNGRVLMPT